MREAELTDDIERHRAPVLGEKLECLDGLGVRLGRKLGEAHGLGRDTRVTEALHHVTDDGRRRAFVDELQHAR